MSSALWHVRKLLNSEFWQKALTQCKITSHELSAGPRWNLYFVTEFTLYHLYAVFVDIQSKCRKFCKSNIKSNYDHFYFSDFSESEFPSLSLVWLNYFVQIMEFIEKWMAVMSSVVFKILWLTWATKSESFRDEASSLYFLMSSSVTGIQWCLGA